jgi:uncharacterized circularly permuted ATP-grasp superfamily protein
VTIAAHRVVAPFWDELFHADGRPRPEAGRLVDQLRGLGIDELQARQDAADLDILAMGITFTVYSDGRGIDRPWPFDVIPRIIDAAEWRTIEAGLIQRLTALNRFIDDVYNDQRVVADGVFPAELLTDSASFRAECLGVQPRYGVWAHARRRRRSPVRPAPPRSRSRAARHRYGARRGRDTFFPAPHAATTARRAPTRRTRAATSRPSRHRASPG